MFFLEIAMLNGYEKLTSCVLKFFEIAMLNGNGRAEQDFWSLAADE